MIEINKISKKYASQIVLKDISLKIDTGSFNVLFGRSGSGKSTFLKCISGLLKVDEGSVVYDGIDINTLNDKEKSKFRNKEIGFVFQSGNLEPNYSGYENIELPMIIMGLSSKERKRKIQDVCDLIDISSIIRKKTALLSGGEKQKIAIAKSIINNPNVIFADEPCGSLDKYNSDMVINLLKKIHQNNVTIVLVTHQVSDFDFAENKYLLDNNTITKYDKNLF